MTADPTDLYGILDLTPRATQEQVRHAYRALVRQHHPDTRSPAPPADASTNDRLQQVVSAYAVLGDPGRRAVYDQRRATYDRHPSAYDQRTAGARSASSPAVPVVVRSSLSAAEQPPIVVGPVRWHHGAGRTT
jgi:curved DNA-binding protein CbpA